MQDIPMQRGKLGSAGDYSMLVDEYWASFSPVPQAIAGRWAKVVADARKRRRQRSRQLRRQMIAAGLKRKL